MKDGCNFIAFPRSIAQFLVQVLVERKSGVVIERVLPGLFLFFQLFLPVLCRVDVDKTRILDHVICQGVESSSRSNSRKYVVSCQGVDTRGAAGWALGRDTAD